MEQDTTSESRKQEKWMNFMNRFFCCVHFLLPLASFPSKQFKQDLTGLQRQQKQQFLLKNRKQKNNSRINRALQISANNTELACTLNPIRPGYNCFFWPPNICIQCESRQCNLLDTEYRFNWIQVNGPNKINASSDAKLSQTGSMSLIFHFEVIWGFHGNWCQWEK